MDRHSAAIAVFYAKSFRELSICTQTTSSTGTWNLKTFYSQSLIMTGTRWWKLADFGLSRIVSEDASHLSRTQTDGYSPVLRPFGTDGWIAPEVLNDERTYTQSADIFPLGLIFAFTLSRRRHPYDVDPPKDDETKEEAEKRIISRNNRIKLKMPMTLTVEQLNNDDHKAFELIRRMLLADAKKRPTAVQVLEHNFFQRDPQVRCVNYWCNQYRINAKIIFCSC